MREPRRREGGATGVRVVAAGVTRRCSDVAGPGVSRGALFDRDLLHVPQGARALVEDVVALGMHGVNEAAGLSAAQARLRPAEEFPGVLVELIDLAVAVATVDVFGGDLHRPRCADARDGL